ncbi:isochorismatase family protein [uncultured Maritimibacter sp.]|uniref:isochorismatase family protein n=1 Tax=uncultured Maritimibacter sp. TaxID=991866 RepID=UPI002592973E|nr:isochorismatase family protein [uncultured Maritimibacter sp.]
MTAALVVIDMQVSLIEDETPNTDEIMSAVFRLVERARGDGVPVVWVLDTGVTPDPSLHPVFKPKPGEAVVRKDVCNAFVGTTLAGELGGRGVDRIVVCGMQSDACIDETVHAAPNYGFAVTLVGDAHTTHDFHKRDFRDVIATVNANLAKLKDVEVVGLAEVTLA